MHAQDDGECNVRSRPGVDAGGQTSRWFLILIRAGSADPRSMRMPVPSLLIIMFAGCIVWTRVRRRPRGTGLSQSHLAAAWAGEVGRGRGSHAPYLDVTDSIRLGKTMEGLHTAARANKDLDQLSKVGAADLDHVLQRALLWNGRKQMPERTGSLAVVSACPSSPLFQAEPSGWTS